MPTTAGCLQETPLTTRRRPAGRPRDAAKPASAHVAIAAAFRKCSEAWITEWPRRSHSQGLEIPAFFRLRPPKAMAGSPGADGSAKQEPGIAARLWQDVGGLSALIEEAAQHA
jgi:hypothetical protein